MVNKIEDLIYDYVDEKERLTFELERAKSKYVSNKVDSYECFHLKWLIGYLEGQLVIIDDILKFFNYGRGE